MCFFFSVYSFCHARETSHAFLVTSHTRPILSLSPSLPPSLSLSISLSHTHTHTHRKERAAAKRTRRQIAARILQGAAPGGGPSIPEVLLSPTAQPTADAAQSEAAVDAPRHAEAVRPPEAVRIQKIPQKTKKNTFVLSLPKCRTPTFATCPKCNSKRPKTRPQKSFSLSLPSDRRPRQRRPRPTWRRRRRRRR